MALSTTKTKYMVVIEAGKEVIWMKDFIDDLGMKRDHFLLHYDNQSAIHFAKNVVYHSQTRHIQRRYHWLREKVELVKIHTNNNGSDMLEKVLTIDKLKACTEDRYGGLPHTRVKGEFVVKDVPHDGRRAS